MFNPNKKIIENLRKEDLKLPEYDREVEELDENYLQFFKSRFEDWDKNYHTKRSAIEKTYNINILGQGKHSIVFTSPDLPDEYVMSYCKSISEADSPIEKNKDPKKRLVEKTFKLKANFYLNRVMNILFPGKIAKIHYWNVDEKFLHETTVREKIDGVTAGYGFYSSWQAFEIPTKKSADGNLKISEIKNLMWKNNIPIYLDLENINNVLIRKDGSECYVDGELESFDPYEVEDHSFDNIQKLMKDLNTPDADQRKIMTYIDRIKALEAEYKTTMKEIDPDWGTFPSII
ncbi:MAG: hypothetical protein K9M36_02620 [Candidatus Pacebacteria bacterium]|nr:hypothetical protein [Candidatus Paceibacterota bacterium]